MQGVRKGSRICQLLIALCVCNVIGHQRIGLPSDTLHVAEENQNDVLGNRIFTINAQLLYGSSTSTGLETEWPRHHRTVRSTDTQSHGTPKSVTARLANDHHTTLIVHWAGEGSDVIIALAKNSSEVDQSDLYVSYDYGKTFTDVNPMMTVSRNGPQAVINKYYTVNKLNTHYLFTDLHSHCLFTTDDSCKTFTRHCGLPFKPRSLSVHPHNAAYMLGLDEESQLKQLYLSNDYGFNWIPVLSNVKAFYWDFPGSNDSSKIYVQEEQAGGLGQVLSISLASFARSRLAESKGPPPTMSVLLRDVVDFQVKGDYIFATRSVSLLGSHTKGPTMQLWISHKGEQFSKAEFPNWKNVTDFYVADASEGQLMVCVSHNASHTNLYISDVNSYKFSLSLERVVYFNPKKSANNNWIRSYTNKPFADVTKISGVGGIYIASQQSGNSLSLNEQVSLISYDKGAVWQPITPPAKAINGQKSQCTDGCSLHLTQMFHQLHPASKFAPILSQDSAPGMVVASGVLGSNLKGNPDVFVSTNAGIGWKIALPGPYLYAMADQGGIIAAIHLQMITKELLYSIDDGDTWESFIFANSLMRVYGLLTEPGENTTIFTVFGSPASHHSWTIIQVDMNDVFEGKKCQDSDYKMWSVREDLPSDKGCLLGRVTQYQRRNAKASCYNGKDFVRETVESNCLCTREDFECDYGYKESSFSSTLCGRDRQVPDSKIHQVPEHCAPGTYYKYTRGYRKVPGDTCEGGQDHSFNPLLYACPVRKRPEFLLLTSAASISMLDLGSARSTNLLEMDYSPSVAAVFDWEKNSLIFVDSDHLVKKVSLEQSNPYKEILLEQDSKYATVKSLAFEWTGRNVFVVRADTHGNSVIDVVNVDHRFERRLCNLPDVKSLVLDPHDGFMYFVGKSASSQLYHIFRASMDGGDEHPTHVFNSSVSVGANTVMTLDRESGQLYWIDPLTKCLNSVLVTGASKNPGTALNLPILLRSRGGDTLDGPSGIATYKDYLYVVFENSDMVMMASKSDTHDWLVFTTYRTGVIGMVEVSNTSHHAMSACSPYHHPCSQLCLPLPSQNSTAPGGHNRVCLCGKGYKVTKASPTAKDEMCACEASEIMKENGLCSANASSCVADKFTCHNGNCEPKSYQCDGEDDCGDNSDEMDCEFQTCRKGSFTCHSGKCIMESWHCDGTDDCRDGIASDELNCENHECKTEEFECKNHYCIRKSWVCDGDNDCHDNSDEENCDSSSSSSCSPWEFTCDDSTCVDAFLECNHNWDCQDGSDEKECNQTQTRCKEDFQFSCGDQNNTCILKSWVCDTEEDCLNGKDEENCETRSTVTPSPHGCLWGFQCENSVCVGFETLCNGVDDCGDNSDEVSCPARPTTSTTTATAPVDCPLGHFSCRTQSNSFRCLPDSARCNNIVDCADGMDEIDCDHTCRSDQFRCKTNVTTSCVWRRWVCDGEPDCPNGEDEDHCEDYVTCSPHEWTCAKGGSCVPLTDHCDGKLDCDDASDELGCDDINCSIFDSNLEACCNEEKCGVYLIKTIHWFLFFDREKGMCKPFKEAAANVDHSLCSTRYVPVQCGKDQFSCSSKERCLSFTQVCNGHNDCNNEDEAGCECDRETEGTPPISEVTNTSVTWILDDIFSNFSYALVVEGLQAANLSWIRHPAESGKHGTVQNLKPAQQYNFVFNYNNSRCLTEPVSVRLDDGLPSAPQGLKVTNKKEYKAEATPVFTVDVTWKAPASPRGTIRFYVIYYQQIHNDGTAASNVYEHKEAVSDVVGTSSQQFRDTVVEHIENGRTYHFWIAAVTDAGVGQASKKQTINISPGPEKSLQPKIKVISESSLNLMWQPQPNIKGYRILVTTVEPSDPTRIATPDKVVDLPGSSNHYKIQELCPGSTVLISLHARYGDSKSYESHPKDTLQNIMSGVQPKVNITKLELNGATSVLFSYEVTQGKVPGQKFLIYYTEDLAVAAKNVSVSDTAHSLEGLKACEHYFVWVRPSYLSCPASRFKLFTTQEDLTAPPKDVKAQLVRHKDHYSVNLTWAASCGQDNLNMNYVITTFRGKERGDFILKSTSKVFEVTPKLTYTFRIRLDVDGSKLSEPLKVTIPSLDGPINLIMFRETEHKAIVRWDWPPRRNWPEFKEYILHTSGPAGFKLTNHTARSEILLHLGQDGWYNFTVEVKDKKDELIAETLQPARYMYEAYVEAPQPTPSGGGSSMSSTNLMAILIPVVLVVVALSAALVFFIVRHKRLQRSFLAFANSHYNIQSGTTTFSDDLDGDEPLIQGFSDDEPLVIA